MGKEGMINSLMVFKGGRSGSREELRLSTVMNGKEHMFYTYLELPCNLEVGYQQAIQANRPLHSKPSAPLLLHTEQFT